MSRIIRRLRALLRRETLEREMDDEMRAHLDLEAEHLVRTRDMTAAEARRQAARAFGGVDRYKEHGRDARGVRPFQDLADDLRHAARALRRSPGYTLPASLTLALGIGMTTAVFSVVHSVLLRPLPFTAPGELVSIREVRAAGAGEAHVVGRAGEINASLATYAAWRELRQTVAVTAFMAQELVLTGPDARVTSGAAVAAGFFDLLGVPLHIGRPFTSDDDASAAPRAVILGYGLWRSRFGGEATVLGRTVEIGGIPHEVIGIAAPAFDYPGGAELWTPIHATLPTDLATMPQLKMARVIGRLAEGHDVGARRRRALRRGRRAAGQ
jgi:putative ABC transport system permease protein